MTVAVVTGSAGLVGSESARLLAHKGLDVVGIDNDMRRSFFGDSASTAWNRRRLERELKGYVHLAIDIRDATALEAVFARYGRAIGIVIHAAAQPSHDWAAREPATDFAINATGSLNVLEMTRRHCPEAAFIFTSTNKVYGDLPNHLPLIELATRWDVAPGHPYAAEGIDETMGLDRTMHSLFGVSKLAADVMVQEYGRYFGMKTVCFRGGCLTGPAHSGAEAHGFLAYLVRCAVENRPYTVFGYKGKQVRDNIHASDLVAAFWRFFEAPRAGEVYNIGGGRHANCSIREAVAICERLTGRQMQIAYREDARAGDHIWWISDVRRFQSHYPGWVHRYDVEQTLREMVEAQIARNAATA